MIKLGFINNHFFIDCSELEYIQMYRYMIWLKYFNKSSITPKFVLVKETKYIIFLGPCEILKPSMIKKNEIIKINKIINILDLNNINLNYLEQIPFLKNRETNDIYFINYIWTTGKITNDLNIECDVKILYDKNIISNRKNKYIIKKFYNLELDIIKSVNLYTFLLITEYHNDTIIKLLSNIKQLNKLRVNNIIIITIIEKFYNKIQRILVNDKFNRYMLIKVNDNYNSNRAIYDIFIELENYKLDYLFILNINNQIFDEVNLLNNINIIIKKNLVNLLFTNHLGNLKVRKHLDIINKYKFNTAKNLLKFTSEDIDLSTLKYRNKLVNKSIFLKKKSKCNFEYDFINRLSPKIIKLDNILLDKVALTKFVNNNLKKHSKEKLIEFIDKITSEVLISMLCFYNKTTII